jgi:hypothetical protein
MPEQPSRTIKNLMAGMVVLRSDVTALIAALEAVAERAGVADVGGLSVAAFHARQRVRELQRELLAIEDDDPALAALVQQQIDHARQLGGLPDPDAESE